jgi:hypothetical protein
MVQPRAMLILLQWLYLEIKFEVTNDQTNDETTAKSIETTKRQLGI